MSDYERGYREGFQDGITSSLLSGGLARNEVSKTVARRTVSAVKKRQRSPKQRLLDEMADKEWKKYKRTTKNGKKTYIDIRSSVSRSRKYKDKCKRM